MTEHRPRAICCHEAGHAVVAWSLKLPVTAIHIINKETGWHGGTVAGKADDLRDQVMVLAAGRAAGSVFECPADERAWLWDFAEIASLLLRHGISRRQEIDQQIDEADGRARRVLEAHRDKVLKLTELLVDGDVDRTTFERLMNDGMPPAS
jgi:ATP-dependent Zn protease